MTRRYPLAEVGTLRAGDALISTKHGFVRRDTVEEVEDGNPYTGEIDYRLAGAGWLVWDELVALGFEVER